ncbi:MAG TPA: recombination protein RecR [Porphyromonadaceae bacterium]|nr:recombination protein RecR [Porphyromonadaceae bacterium]
MNYPSKLLQESVEAISLLPGIGKKTALRLVLHLLREEKEEVIHIGETLIKLANEIVYCEKCHNISDTPLCEICSDKMRDQSIICVVENVKEVMAIENTQVFKGIYHVLGGLISPMEGIGPSHLEIQSLIQRVQEEHTKEVILALSATNEGDTTNFYIYKKLSPLNVKITLLSRGVSVGDELEYIDEVTLGRSILNRCDFSSTLKC